MIWRTGFEFWLWYFTNRRISLVCHHSFGIITELIWKRYSSDQNIVFTKIHPKRGLRATQVRGLLWSCISVKRARSKYLEAM